MRRRETSAAPLLQQFKSSVGDHLDDAVFGRQKTSRQSGPSCNLIGELLRVEVLVLGRPHTLGVMSKDMACQVEDRRDARILRYVRSQVVRDVSPAVILGQNRKRHVEAMLPDAWADPRAFTPRLRFGRLGARLGASRRAAAQSLAPRSTWTTVNGLRRYWIVLEGAERLSRGLGHGCGVTAIDLADAVRLMEQKIFKGKLPAPVKAVTEDVDVSTLDAGHVLPNMLPPDRRGIWFPMGYD